LRSWKIVETSDLAADDRDLWRASRGSECPGIATGKFRTPTGVAYAILLAREEAGRRRERLVVVESRPDGRYRSEVLREDRADTAWVIWKGPPATYRSADRSTEVTIALDGIVLEKLEAGAILYYWARGRYRSLIISE
jgi:hypothetical protein